MNIRLSLAGVLLVAPLCSGLQAQDLGSLSVFVGTPNKGDPVAEAGFQARCAQAAATLGQGQTMISGFANFRERLGQSWINDANWFRGSVLASAVARKMTPVYSVGLADAVTDDPVGQMLAVGDPNDTVYGPVFQNIINGFRNSGFPKLYLRIGWEHNGEWYPWATTQPYKTFNPTRTAAFLAAWRRVANLAHNTPGIEVLTVWSPNFERLTPEEMALTYPGDEYVDIIAPDMYSPVWNSIPQNWDPEIGGTSPDAEWKTNLVNRQHSWDYPMGTPSDPTAGYGLVAMLDFALAHNKPFGLGETGTGGGTSSGIYRGPKDRGDFPLYLHKRFSQWMERGLKFSYLGLWNSGSYRFTSGGRIADTASWVTLLNLLAGSEPLQAEDLPVVAASDPVANVFELGATGNYVPDSSRWYVREEDLGGEISLFNANAANDYVQYRVPLLDSGNHTIKLRVKVGPTRGRYRLQVAGANFGPVMDFYSPIEEYVVVNVGRRGFPAAQNYRFRMVCVGRNANSSGHSLALDYIELDPDRLEAELLATGALTDSTTVVRDPSMNNDAGERFNADAVGDYIEYVVPIVNPGTYAIEVRVKKNFARGRFQLAIDGRDLGSEQDQYTPFGDPNPYEILQLGTRTFDRVGDKTFRFTVTGHHPEGSGYRLLFDYIAITKQ